MKGKTASPGSELPISCWSRDWCCWREHLKGDGDTRCERTVWPGHEYLLGQGSSGVTFEELCNTGTCCIPLLLGSTSGSAGVSVPHSPLSTVKVPVQRLSVIFISVCLSLLPSGRAMRQWPWFPFGLEMLMLSFLTPGKGLLFGKKRAEHTCVCLWNTHCVARWKWALVKIQSEEEFVRWFDTWKGLHARGKALAPFSASFSALFHENVRELCAITQETFHDDLVPFYKEIYCSLKPSLLLGWQAWCWFRDCLVPQGFATSQNKAPLWAGLHCRLTPRDVLTHLPRATKALLETDPNPSQVIQGICIIWECFGIDSVPLNSLSPMLNDFEICLFCN